MKTKDLVLMLLSVAVGVGGTLIYQQTSTADPELERCMDKALADYQVCEIRRQPYVGCSKNYSRAKKECRG